MDREERNRIFDKAGVRKTPMLFIDDQYVGDYDDVSTFSRKLKCLIIGHRHILDYRYRYKYVTLA